MQDCGAAGITSAAIEMAERSELGLKIDVSKVPVKEDSMTPYEIMLSESQERMLIAVKKNQHQRIFDILEKWDLKCSIIGEFIEGNEVQIFDGEKIISQTSIEALTSPPEYDLSLLSKGYKNKKNKIKIKEEYKNFDKK